MYGTGTRSPEQQEIDSIFALMDAAIRTHEYSASDLFAMIGELIDENPILAQSIAMHASNVLATGTDDPDGKIRWVDVVVEAYRRALFDLEESPRYGTPFLLKDINRMRSFVQAYIENQTFGANTMPGSGTAQPRQ